MTTATKAEIIRKPLMSGHCAGHAAKPDLSPLAIEAHARCDRNGGGNRANPLKEWQPCPCPHHYAGAEVYECGGCGREIVEAPHWPLDEDGDTRYTHIDGTGRALGEDCADKAVSRNTEPDPEKDCVRCGKVFRGTGRGRLCPSCVRDDEREAEAKRKAEVEDLDALMAELDEEEDEDDEFDDLDDLLADFEDD